MISAFMWRDKHMKRQLHVQEKGNFYGKHFFLDVKYLWTSTQGLSFATKVRHVLIPDIASIIEKSVMCDRPLQYKRNRRSHLLKLVFSKNVAFFQSCTPASVWPKGLVSIYVLYVYDIPF